MRDVKTRAAMEQPKTRQKNAMPRTAVRILQRHYAQQKLYINRQLWGKCGEKLDN